MRRLILIGAVLLTLSVACNNNKDEVEDTGVIEEVVVNDTMSEIQPNPSDVNFVTALEEYQEGNYKKAADDMEAGIINLREEEKSTEMVNGRLLNGAIVKLRSMEDQVRAGNVEDMDVLSQAMMNAEMLVAHDYMIYTVNSLTENPSKTAYYFDKAMESLDRVIPKLSGQTKEEAVQIRDKSMRMADKLGTDSANVKEILQEQTKKIEEFLQKHANEMM